MPWRLGSTGLHVKDGWPKNNNNQNGLIRMGILRNIIAGAFALCAVGMAAPAAEAQPVQGYAAYNVNLMAGPATYYPYLLTIPRGARIVIYGCFQDWSWCDVSWGYQRGWVNAALVRVIYYDRPVYLPDYGYRLGIPFLTFNFFFYWNDHYRTRPFYREQDRYFQYFNRDTRRWIDHSRDNDRRFDGDRRNGPPFGQGNGGNNTTTNNNSNNDRRFGPNAGTPNAPFNGGNDNDDRRRFQPQPNFGNNNPPAGNGPPVTTQPRYLPPQTFGGQNFGGQNNNPPNGGNFGNNAPNNQPRFLVNPNPGGQSNGPPNGGATGNNNQPRFVPPQTCGC